MWIVWILIAVLGVALAPVLFQMFAGLALVITAIPVLIANAPLVALLPQKYRRRWVHIPPSIVATAALFWLTSDEGLRGGWDLFFAVFLGTLFGLGLFAFLGDEDIEEEDIRPVRVGAGIITVLAILGISIWGPRIDEVQRWQENVARNERRLTGLSVTTEVLGDTLLLRVANPTDVTYDTKLRINYDPVGSYWSPAYGGKWVSRSEYPYDERVKELYGLAVNPGETTLEVPIPSWASDSTHWEWQLNIGDIFNYGTSGWARFEKSHGASMICELVARRYNLIRKEWEEATWRCGKN